MHISIDLYRIGLLEGIAKYPPPLFCR
jgi:hypothetical protein